MEDVAATVREKISFESVVKDLNEVMEQPLVSAYVLSESDASNDEVTESIE